MWLALLVLTFSSRVSEAVLVCLCILRLLFARLNE